MTYQPGDDSQSSPAVTDWCGIPSHLFDRPVVPLFFAALHSRRTITFVLTDSDTLEALARAAGHDTRGGHYGLADLEEAVIYLDEANTTGEMRATITHEIAHLTYPTWSDEAVEAMAAELLVPLPDAIEAVARGAIEEVAERLAVDGHLIRARIRAAAGTPHTAADRTA
jgi:hypothetical protein